MNILKFEEFNGISIDESLISDFINEYDSNQYDNEANYLIMEDLIDELGLNEDRYEDAKSEAEKAKEERNRHKSKYDDLLNRAIGHRTSDRAEKKKHTAETPKKEETKTEPKKPDSKTSHDGHLGRNVAIGAGIAAGVGAAAYGISKIVANRRKKKIVKLESELSKSKTPEQKKKIKEQIAKLKKKVK